MNVHPQMITFFKWLLGPGVSAMPSAPMTLLTLMIHTKRRQVPKHNRYLSSAAQDVLSHLMRRCHSAMRQHVVVPPTHHHRIVRYLTGPILLSGPQHAQAILDQGRTSWTRAPVSSARNSAFRRHERRRIAPNHTRCRPMALLRWSSAPH